MSTVFTRMVSNLTLRPLSFDEPISTMAFVNANTLFGNNTWDSTLDLHEIGVVPTGLQLVRSDPNIFNGQPRMTFAGGTRHGIDRKTAVAVEHANGVAITTTAGKTVIVQGPDL